MRGLRGVVVVATLALTLPVARDVSATWDPVWRRSAAFSVEAVATDGAGNVYVTGFVPRGTPPSWVMVLRKVDADGTRLWTRTWRSVHRFYPQAAGFDITLAPDGRRVYVIGARSNDTGEDLRAQIWAYTPDGALRWTRQTTLGGTAFSGVAVRDGVVAGGWGWLGMWGSDGSPMWTRPFLDPTGDHCDVVQDVAVGSAGDIVAVGFIDRTPTCNDSEGGVFTDADVVIQKRSATGSLRWTNVLTDPGRDNDEALGVDVAGRQIYVSGERNGSAWIARLDDRGRFDWQRRWGAADLRPRAMDVSASPWATVYVVSDRHRDPTSVGGLLGLRAYTANGDLQGIRTMRLMQGETGSGVVASSIGAVYVTARIFAERGDLWRMPV